MLEGVREAGVEGVDVTEEPIDGVCVGVTGLEDVIESVCVFDGVAVIVLDDVNEDVTLGVLDKEEPREAVIDDVGVTDKEIDGVIDDVLVIVTDGVVVCKEVGVTLGVVLPVFELVTL